MTRFCILQWLSKAGYCDLGGTDDSCICFWRSRDYIRFSHHLRDRGTLEGLQQGRPAWLGCNRPDLQPLCALQGSAPVRLVGSPISDPHHQHHRVAHSHDRSWKSLRQGNGFGVGLWLLSFIFVPVLGFGSAQYGESQVSFG